jgi:hypothetical protein
MTITLKQASEEFLSHLKAEGKAERSLYTYGKDLEQIRAFFGDEKILSKILIPHVSGFLKSNELRMKAAKEGLIERAKPTIDKTIRIFRMLMIWAKEKQYIQKLPFTKELES